MATVAKAIDSGSGFFSKIKNSLGTGLSTGLGQITSNVLPRWANNQINGQATNKLNQDTVNQKLQAPKLGQLPSIASIKKSPIMLMVIAGASLVIIALIFKIKR